MGEILSNGAVYRAHPITIFFHLKRFVLLWIIPILRAVISAIQGELSLWGQGLWLDLFVISLILLFAIMRWWKCIYSYNENFIVQQDGLFFSKTIHLKWENISVLKIRHPILLRPFKAIIFQADTLGGSYRKPDIDLCLKKKDVDKLLAFHFVPVEDSDTAKNFTPKKSSILAFAVASTNSAIGFFYISAFISQSGKLLGRKFSDMIIGSFENLARTLSQEIPPAATAIAFVIAFTWLIGVCSTMMQYHNFTLQKLEDRLVLSGGLFSKQKFIFNIKEINYLNIRQNIITHILKIYSVFVHSVGTNKERTDINCIIPANSKVKYQYSIDYLLPEFKNPATITVKPAPLGFMRFLMSPIALILFVLLMLRVSLLLVPSWSSFIRFVCYMLFIPCVSFLLVRFVEYRSSGLGKQGNIYTITYSKRFSVHTLLIPKERISGIKICQSWIQRLSGNCDIFIYTISERTSHHKCRNLNAVEAATFFQMNPILSNMLI